MGEVPAATGDQHLKTELAPGISPTTTAYKGLRGRPGKEVRMTLTDDPHLSMVRPVVPQTPEGCAECLLTGSPWVHLRLCLTCGHVGCCDSSPNRHARLHAHALGHPIVQSFQPGEDWRWCYVDEALV